MFYSPKKHILHFVLRTLFLAGFLFSFHFSHAQSERDSIQQLLFHTDLTPLEKWNTLSTFIAKEAGYWSGNYIDYADTLLQISTNHLPNKIAEAYYFLGKIHLNKNDLDKSIKAFQNGLIYIDKSDNQFLEPKILRGIGNIFYKQNQLDQAGDYFLKAFNGSTVLSDTLMITLCHISIANILVDQLSFDSSAYHIHRAKDLAIAANINTQLTTIYNNIIFLEDERGHYENARSYIYELLSHAKKFNDTEAQFMGFGNLAYSFGKHEQKYDSAIHYFKLGLQYYDPKNTEAETLPIFYKEIAESYRSQGNADSAVVYLQKYIDLNDSIQQKHFNQSVQEIEAKYQTEEKEKQLLQAQLETEHQANLRRLTLGIALGIIILLFAVFQYFKYRQRLKHQQTEISLKLEQAEAQQMRELDRLKSNFFANISHEFRTPLTLILGPIEQLKNNQLKGEIQQYAPMMLRNANRLKELINQLLDLSKLESSQMKLVLEDGDIFQFSRQMVNSFESWANQKELDYQYTIPNIPFWVKYDRDKFEKILSNLISNAIKYTPNEGSIRISLKSEAKEDSIRLVGFVKDSGYGVPKAEQEFIFQRFYQGSKSEDGAASSGIGLALTKELIELHNGSISISSIQDQGTQFDFEIPFQPATSHSNNQPDLLEISDTNGRDEQVAIHDLSTVSQTNIKSKVEHEETVVLVVEDNDDVRNYIIDQIKDQYQILYATNGEEGLSIAIEKIPDLIITDLMMPKMTGHELTHQLKTDQRTSHIPIIILTAKEDMKDRIKGLETGADDYLTKPFNTIELQLRVKNMISQRQLLRSRFNKAGVQLTPKEIAVNSVDEIFLNRWIEILEKEIDNEQLSVEGLAHMIGMSRSQLHRKLTALTDKSPNSFIRSFRMQRAHQLLTQNAGNASEIAFMVGFSSLTYFSKCFKDEYGISPSKVLKQD